MGNVPRRYFCCLSAGSSSSKESLTSSLIDTLQDSDLHGNADQSPELPPQRARHHLHFYCLDIAS